MGWLNIFGRLTGAPLGDSAEDWQAGDQAECINGLGWVCKGLSASIGPELGEVRVVRKVHVSALQDNSSVQFLIFDRYGESAYLASCFRKSMPRADAANRADPAFIADLKKQPVLEEA
jgi:hypothetical protein